MKSIFVYNPESGKGKLKKYKDYIVQNLSNRYGEIDVVETQKTGHAREIAEQSIGKYDYFFIAGGDGTLNEVINGFAGREDSPIIGYIPCGTVNDVARSLGIERNIKKCINQLTNGEAESFDTFKINDRYGFYVCCAGLFTQSSYSTARKTKKHLGKIAYFFQGAKDFFSSKSIKLKWKDDNGNDVVKKCSLLLIINSRSVAGFKINKKANLHDGKVDIIIFESKKDKVKLSEMIQCMNLFIRGLDKTKTKKYVTYKQLDQFSIQLEDEATINIDGENAGKTNININVIKDGIKIIIPKRTKDGNKNKSK